jgi:ABC-type glycerol-3-phosphate transport system substrate-binding protein
MLKKLTQFLSVKKIVMLTITLLVIFFILMSFFQRQTLNGYVTLDRLLNSDVLLSTEQYNAPLYRDVLMQYNMNRKQNTITSIPIENFSGRLVHEDMNDYEDIFDTSTTKSGYEVSFEQNLIITHDNIEEGLYYLGFSYFITDNSIDAVQMEIKINGEIPFYEAQTINLPSPWFFESDEFMQDRYNNDIQPRSFRLNAWQETLVRDYKGIYQEPYLFELNDGDVMTISYINAAFIITDIRYESFQGLNSYDTYIAQFQNEEVIDELIMISARNISYRSDPSIRLRVEQDPSNMYYNTQQLRLNTIFGDSWQSGGQSVTYDVDIQTSGLYQLSFKYRQYLLKELPVFRTIKINGEIPFDAFQHVAFPFTMSFLNRTVLDEEGNPYYVYLEEGTHTITLEATISPYKNEIEIFKYVMNQIQSLALDIKRYTSGGTDRFRDWDISVYFPNAVNDIKYWVSLLRGSYERLETLSFNSDPSELANLNVSIDRLISISNNINSLPSRMVQFSDGDASVNQMLGTLAAQLMRSNMELERTMIHGDVLLPRPYANIFVNVWEGLKRLVLSFVNNPYSINNNDEDLNVWVNYPRQYIEIMQIMIDQSYNGGRKVTLSQMPDQNKLILANTSGQAPDVALGVDHWIPYEFAIRGAAANLRTLPNYEEVVSEFSKGAMIPYAFEDGIYGIPSTQNFWVTYYRTDILSSIGLQTIPSTWDEVVQSLPLLQSYGLNYFIPLAQFSGLKPFVATIPFIYQFGGDLYDESGMQTGINSSQTIQGIELMSELFTLYNVDKFVGNFFNAFRFGTLPIGIGDLSTYILLSAAADELDGLWNMALHPGQLNPETNEVNRLASVGAQSNMILSQSDYQEEAWDFLSWWMSEEIQLEFAFTLLSTYGKEYFWNTANIAAFMQIPMPIQHRQVIMEQWEYAIEAPRIPGSYMVEREISNAWTNIVFNGANPRQALDEAVRIANREIAYKMSEFGYMSNGIIIKNYIVPTIDNIDMWLKGDNS